MVRIFIVFAVACVAGLAIQALFVHALFPAAVAPDFTLILVVYLALFHRSPLGVLGAFLLGMSADFASGQFVGPNAGGSVVAYLIVVWLSQKIYAEKGFAVAILTAVGSIAKSALQVGMLALYVKVDAFDVPVLKVIAIEALLSAIIAPFFLAIVDRLRRKRTSGQRVKGATLRWSH